MISDRLKDKRLVFGILLIASVVAVGSIVAMQSEEMSTLLIRGTGDPPSIRIVHSETIDHDVGGVTTYTMYIIIYVTDGDEILDENDEVIFKGDVIEITSEYSYPPAKDETRVWFSLDLIVTTTPQESNNPLVKTYTKDFTETTGSISIRVYATDFGGNKVFEKRTLSVLKSGFEISGFEFLGVFSLVPLILIRKILK